MSSPPSEAALSMHEEACKAREAGYMDPESGLFVLTSHYLRARGKCCGKGCRHCPWPTGTQDAAGRSSTAPAWPWPPATS